MYLFRRFTLQRRKNKVVNYLNSISFISDVNAEISESFMFKTKFPLGKTGKGEFIPQDRFTGIETTVTDNVSFVKNLVEYIDEYLFLKTSI